MAKRKSKSKRGSKKSQSQVFTAATCQVWTPQVEREYYKRLGCHIATVARPLSPRKNSKDTWGRNDPTRITCSQLDELHRAAQRDYPWLIGVELFDPSDYFPEDIAAIPDVAMSDACEEDEDPGCLTVANTSNETKICFVTVFDVDVCDVNGQTLTGGTTVTTTRPRRGSAQHSSCFVHAILSCTCVRSARGNIWRAMYHSRAGRSDVMSPDEDERAYFCSQSEHGQLTHYFAGNHHAIDFACPMGTMLHSPVDGTVVQVNDTGGGEGHEVSGIAATNMFQWNSIMLRVDDDQSPLFVELVHIQTKSCVVKCGDKVRRGQLICRSGSVGFSPEPHVHMAAYRSAENAAATVRFRFKRRAGRASEETGESSRAFVAMAGGWYTSSGLVSEETDANK
ncbi:hypothetical protein THAOC_30742 [Thalassiosira oceanica]|uniref:M23ase beta-sheet core domain-containing protein n=1 Tax=Thalassiosira oceanica TaxID=159749 RepID=K0RDG3_THAOC|nr:hypothetical protein THAOC_30742 [Thalassiosira oceanica]|eukprot:EJK50314.1 hypothetical protein THAOC_30742 [Thalassiosira oceanica]